MEVGLLVLRLVVGAFFVGHGAQKLFGWFGGHGPDGTGAFFESTGMARGREIVLLAGAAELVGGLLFAFGLLTPLAATLLSAVMLAAILKVHRGNGLWITDNGFEYNLVLLAVLFAVTAAGAGDWSLDGMLGLELAGPGWALAQLAAAVVGVGLALGFERLSHDRDRTAAAGGF